MKVKCIKTSFADDLEVAQHRQNDIHADLDISLGEHYIVCTIEVSNNDNVEYLIRDDTYYPNLYPANLFEVVDTQLPYEEWHLGKFQYPVVLEDGVVRYFYIFGSKEMATNYDVLMSIRLHEDAGLAHFAEWHELVGRQYE